MRAFAVLFALPLLLGVTPAGAIKKLSGQKTYAFKVETRIDGNLGKDVKAVQEGIVGAFQKPDVIVATAEKKMKMVRRGTNALYFEGGEWKKEGEVDGTPDALGELVELESPYEEIAKYASGVAPLKATLPVDGANCEVFKAEFTKEGAAALAKELLNGAKQGTGLGPRGFGRRRWGGVWRTPIQPLEPKGNVKLMIDPEGELPRQLILEVTFKANFPGKGGKPDEREVTITRTVTLSEFDKAAIDIPDEVKKTLGIAEK